MPCTRLDGYLLTFTKHLLLLLAYQHNLKFKFNTLKMERWQSLQLLEQQDHTGVNGLIGPSDSKVICIMHHKLWKSCNLSRWLPYFTTWTIRPQSLWHMTLGWTPTRLQMSPKYLLQGLQSLQARGWLSPIPVININILEMSLQKSFTTILCYLSLLF